MHAVVQPSDPNDLEVADTLIQGPHTEEKPAPISGKFKFNDSVQNAFERKKRRFLQYPFTQHDSNAANKTYSDTPNCL